jgi:hypothetical protein
MARKARRYGISRWPMGIESQHLLNRAHKDAHILGSLPREKNHADIGIVLFDQIRRSATKMIKAMILTLAIMTITLMMKDRELRSKWKMFCWFPK